MSLPGCEDGVQADARRKQRFSHQSPCPLLARKHYNYLLTYDSYGPVHNRFHKAECITWASGGGGGLDTPGPLNGIERSECHLGHNNQCSIGSFM